MAEDVWDELAHDVRTTRVWRTTPASKRQNGSTYCCCSVGVYHEREVSARIPVPSCGMDQDKMTIIVRQIGGYHTSNSAHMDFNLLFAVLTMSANSVHEFQFPVVEWTTNE